MLNTIFNKKHLFYNKNYLLLKVFVRLFNILMIKKSLKEKEKKKKIIKKIKKEEKNQQLFYDDTVQITINYNSPDDNLDYGDYYRPVQVIDYSNSSNAAATTASITPRVIDYGHKPVMNNDRSAFKPLKIINYDHASKTQNYQQNARLNAGQMRKNKNRKNNKNNNQQQPHQLNKQNRKQKRQQQQQQQNQKQMPGKSSAATTTNEEKVMKWKNNWCAKNL